MHSKLKCLGCEDTTERIPWSLFDKFKKPVCLPARWIHYCLGQVSPAGPVCALTCNRWRKGPLWDSTWHIALKKNYPQRPIFLPYHIRNITIFLSKRWPIDAQRSVWMATWVQSWQTMVHSTGSPIQCVMGVQGQLFYTLRIPLNIYTRRLRVGPLPYF